MMPIRASFPPRTNFPRRPNIGAGFCWRTYVQEKAAQSAPIRDRRGQASTSAQSSSQTWMMRRDQRSPQAIIWRRLYKTTRWQRIREAQLRAHPLCQMCEIQGRLTAATVCDHVTPHRGNEQAFYAGPFSSLCKPCHDRHAQRRDRGGDIRLTGLDGWPIGE